MLSVSVGFVARMLIVTAISVSLQVIRARAKRVRSHIRIVTMVMQTHIHRQHIVVHRTVGMGATIIIAQARRPHAEPYVTIPVHQRY